MTAPVPRTLLSARLEPDVVVQITHEGCQAVAGFFAFRAISRAAAGATTHSPTLKSLRKQLSCPLPEHEHRTE